MTSGVDFVEIKFGLPLLCFWQQWPLAHAKLKGKFSSDLGAVKGSIIEIALNFRFGIKVLIATAIQHFSKIQQVYSQDA